jgi:hypothetical protein
MRSGIIAATVPASRVRTICRCNFTPMRRNRTALAGYDACGMTD